MLNFPLNGGALDELTRWDNSESETDFSLGLYAKGEVIRFLNDDWFAKAYLQEEIADKVEISVGESKYEFQSKGFG